MDKIILKTKNPKCRLYWRYIVSHVGIIDLSCELAPLLPSHCFTSSLPCVNKYRDTYVFIQCVTMGWGRGLGCLESICRSYTLCIWPDSEPTKLLCHPKQKSWRGRDLRQIYTCRQVPLQVNFEEKIIFRIRINFFHQRLYTHGVL